VLHDLEIQDLVLFLEAKDSGLGAESYVPFVLRLPVVAA
jgi:hypothetical protein